MHRITFSARIRDSFSPETEFGLQYRRRGSCHTPVFTWRPRISDRSSSSIQRFTAQCHLRAVSLFLSATSENFFVPATTASIILITVSWNQVLKCSHSTTLILANWTEPNWTMSYMTLLWDIVHKSKRHERVRFYRQNAFQGHLSILLFLIFIIRQLYSS